MEPTISNQPTVIDTDLPCDRQFMFSNHKNVYKKGVEKKQRKLLTKISFLKNFLDTEERIFLMTTGCSPTSMLEQLVTGWAFIYLKRAILVFTNKRIFHIPTKQDFSYRNSIAQIIYSDCASIQAKGSKLVVEYKNGTKETFLYIRRSERKKIKMFLSDISFEGTASKSQKRTHLCPRCTNELQDNVFICSKCRLEFKSKEEGKKYAHLLPGGGYFYTRHPWLGIGDAMAETFLIILVIISVVDIINNVEGSGLLLVMFSIILVIEKAVSVFHSNHYIKEFIPKEKEIKALA